MYIFLHCMLQMGKTEEMVTIKCQRLKEDRTYEEIDLEVPAEVYNNIQMVRDGGPRGTKIERRGEQGKGNRKR